MKKSLLLFFALIISATVFAAQQVDGIIVFDRQPVNVKFLISTGLFGGGPSVEALQKGIRYIDATGKKRTLKPSIAKEFSFEYEGQRYRMVSQQYPGGRRKYFMLQLINGTLSMYQHIETRTSSTGPRGMTQSTTVYHYLLQRNDENLFEPRGLGFRKDMAKYFADCPKLVSMIHDKEFKRRDLDEIVMFYNNNCN